MKRCHQRAFHTSEPIEGPGKRKGTFEGRRRDRHAIACRRSSRIERRNGSHGRIPSKIAAPSSSPASPSLILEETVHQIARLVAAVVRGIPFYNVERAEHQEPSGWPRIERARKKNIQMKCGRSLVLDEMDSGATPTCVYIHSLPPSSSIHHIGMVGARHLDIP